MRSIHVHEWHVCGWKERIPGGSRHTSDLNLGLWGACGREESRGQSEEEKDAPARAAARGLRERDDARGVLLGEAVAGLQS